MFQIIELLVSMMSLICILRKAGQALLSPELGSWFPCFIRVLEGPHHVPLLDLSIQLLDSDLLLAPCTGEDGVGRRWGGGLGGRGGSTAKNQNTGPGFDSVLPGADLGSQLHLRYG